MSKPNTGNVRSATPRCSANLPRCTSASHLRSLQGTFPALGPTCRVASTRGGPSGADSCGPAPRDSSLLRNFPLKIPPAASRPPREVLISAASSHRVPPARRAHRSRLGASQPHVHVRGGGVCGCAPRQHALRGGGAQGRYASRSAPPSSAQECGGRREQALMGATSKRWGTLSLPSLAGRREPSVQPCPTRQAVKRQGTQHQT